MIQGRWFYIIREPVVLCQELSSISSLPLLALEKDIYSYGAVIGFHDEFAITSLQKSFQDLLLKREGVRSAWEYPFAVAGVNITFMLIQMLDLEAGFELCFTMLHHLFNL